MKCLLHLLHSFYSSYKLPSPEGEKEALQPFSIYNKIMYSRHGGEALVCLETCCSVTFKTNLSSVVGNIGRECLDMNFVNRWTQPLIEVCVFDTVRPWHNKWMVNFTPAVHTPMLKCLASYCTPTVMFPTKAFLFRWWYSPWLERMTEIFKNTHPDGVAERWSVIFCSASHLFLSWSPMITWHKINHCISDGMLNTSWMEYSRCAGTKYVIWKCWCTIGCYQF